MSDRVTEQDWLRTMAMIVVAAVAVGAALYLTSAILVPFVIAVFIVSMASPLMDFLIIKARLPRQAAVGATLLVVIAVAAFILVFLASSIDNIMSTAKQYSDSFGALLERVLDGLESRGLIRDQTQAIENMKDEMLALLQATVSTSFSVGASAGFVFIFVLFLLAGRDPRAIRSGFYMEVDQRIRRYINIKVALSFLTGVLVWASLSIIGLEMAMLFGLLAFLLNFIPTVGSLVATCLPIPLAFAQFEDRWGMIIAVILIPGGFQMLIGNVIEPKLMGEGLDLHPVTVLLALSFWGLIWGIPGMVLAVPITAVLRILFLHFDTVRPLAMLMAGELPQPPVQRQ